MLKTSTCRLLSVLAIALAVAFAGLPPWAPCALAATHTGVKQEAPEPSPTAGRVPGHSLGKASDAELWRAIRGGASGSVSIPDKKAGLMVQSEGESWRAIRNGPMTLGGAWAILGVIGLVALYFALHGRIRLEAECLGRAVVRFTFLERSAHWLVATSFIVLALTGLNLLYGRHVLLPILGPEVFAAIAQAGKYAHNYIAFAFMLGLVLMFVVWVRHNLPNRYDLMWLAKGGGMFAKHVHPPAGKFNAGEKIVFWLSILGGALLSLTGLSLLFPFEIAMFKAVFSVLNQVGLDLPADLAPVHEMQLAELVHEAVALVLTAVIIGHIYLGSIGMEGAFGAMASGEVDETWARQHHSVWAAELEIGRSHTNAAPSTG